MLNEHQYIIFSDSPRTGSISKAGLLIANQAFGKNLSMTQWRKDPKLYNIHGKDIANNEITSSSINYLEIVKYLREKGCFDPNAFNLPVFKCFWLDSTFEGKMDIHIHDDTVPEGFAIADGFTKQIYGDDYPITPILSREGHTYTSLQPQLLQRIVKSRTRLIDNSNEALTDDWFFDLRTLISDTVSLIEITLHQIYIMAQYNPLPNWKFDLEKLGVRHGRKFNDKLGWIYKISGNHLSAESHIKQVNNLRELRNHMMHFDPPHLVITIEEATIWLNQIIDVGWLLVKIRKAIGAELSVPLINFILQKEAIFNPEEHSSKRLPLGNRTDYTSCLWPKNL
jgi:hypothetical protein